VESYPVRIYVPSGNEEEAREMLEEYDVQHSVIYYSCRDTMSFSEPEF
jgi:hypothetical protein